MRVLGVLAVWSTVAFAQPAPSEAPTPAQSAFREGRELLEAGKPAEACAKFEASIKLDPEAPGTMLNLGLCNELLGKIATALRWFRKAQFRAAETSMTAYEDAAKHETVQLAPRVPTLKIQNAKGPVTLDGAALSDLEVARVEVDPGRHTIEAGGVKKEVTVEERDSVVVDLAPPPVKRYTVIDHGAEQRRKAYLIGGGGGVLLAGCLTLVLVGNHEYHASEHPETWETWQYVLRYGGTSLFLLGTAAVAGGVYLWVKAPGKQRIEVVPAGAGAVVRGTF